MYEKGRKIENPEKRNLFCALWPEFWGGPVLHFYAK
jgi:hypothetical protein